MCALNRSLITIFLQNTDGRTLEKNHIRAMSVKCHLLKAAILQSTAGRILGKDHTRVTFAISRLLLAPA